MGDRPAKTATPTSSLIQPGEKTDREEESTSQPVRTLLQPPIPPTTEGYAPLMERAQQNLSKQITATTQYLQTAPKLLDHVAMQLTQHLVDAYRQRLTEHPTSGSKRGRKSLPYFEVVSSPDTKTLGFKTNLNGEILVTQIRRLVEELFQKNNLWNKASQDIWSHLIAWAIEEMIGTVGESELRNFTQEQFSQTLHHHLFDRDPNFVQNQISFLEEFYSQSITRQIVQELDLSNYPLSGFERLLGVSSNNNRQKLSPATQVALSRLGTTIAIPTGLPIVSSISAQLQPERWQPDANGIAHFRYSSKQNLNNYLEHYITSPGDIEALPWEAAEQIIDKFGFNTVKLQLIFAAYAMRQSKPWESTFTIKATDIIEELGWDRNHSSNLATKRNEVASIAYALSCLLVKAVWIEGRGKQQVDASTPIGRMWEVLIDSHGQFDWTTGKIDEPDEVFITVRPGLWTAHFLNQAGNKAKEALYQFGYLALNILKLDPYHDELTLRLAIHLTLDVRIRARDRNPYEYKVKTLLESVIPEIKIQEARSNSEKARSLFNRWNHALKLLHHLGWQPDDTATSEVESDTIPTFYTFPYPQWLEPEAKIKKPRGWIDLWLEQKLIIKPPNPIPERMAALGNSRRQSPKLPRSQPEQPLTGTEVKTARKAKGWTQAKLAGTLGVHQSLIAKIESGDRPISTELDLSLRRILDF